MRRDIIAEYADFGSKVYATKIRDGVVKDTLGGSLPPSNKLLSDVNLEEALNLTEKPITSTPKRAENEYSTSARKEMRIQQQLKFIDQRLREQKLAKEMEAVEKPLRFLVKVERPVQRPTTPEIPEMYVYTGMRLF
jgi:hypothetical protein